MAGRRKVAVAVGAALGIASVVAFGPLVRYQAERVAARFGARIDVEGVAPVWLGVRLTGITVQVDDVPAARARLDEAVVRFGGDGPMVALRGGGVTAVGARREVVRQLEMWRSKHGARGDTAGRGRPVDVSMSAIAVSWQDEPGAAPGESVAATDVRVSRGETLSVRAASVQVDVPGISVRAADAQVDLVRVDGERRILALLARSVEAEVRSGHAGDPVRSEESESKPGSVSYPASASSAARSRDVDDVVLGLQTRLRAVAAALRIAALAVDGALAPDAQVSVPALRGRVRVGRDTLSLGPGSVRLSRGDGRLVAALGLGGTDVEAKEGLALRVSIPLAEDGDILAELQGGPIALGLVGVQEGDLGLVDVGGTYVETRSKIVLPAGGRPLSIDGDGRVRGLSVRNERLAAQPIRGLELAWKGRAEVDLDGSRARIDDGEIDVGAVRVLAHGEYARSRNGWRLAGEFEVPLVSCQALLDALPAALAPKLAGMRLAGSFALKGRAKIDTDRLDRDLELPWVSTNSCRVEEVPPSLDVARFSLPFRRVVYGPGDQREELEIGPGTATWVPYGNISKFMETAVLITEDGGFPRHRGFSDEAIRNSIRDNLKAGRFVRGASTISMQLAKNLYLEPTKTLSRKLQEAFLTMYLEQALTKTQILELYLNVIELGPMVYGIGPAARHYFNTSAAELSLGQALYLASILPNPKVQHFGAGGAVTQGWMDYLRRLMRTAHTIHRISDDELEFGLREPVVRGVPAPSRVAAVPSEEQAPDGAPGPP